MDAEGAAPTARWPTIGCREVDGHGEVQLRPEEHGETIASVKKNRKNENEKKGRREGGRKKISGWSG